MKRTVVSSYLRLFFAVAIFAILYFLAYGRCPMRYSGDYSTARNEMVETQIKARGVETEAVLAAMRKVERHAFVPAAFRPFSYNDNPLPIGYDQTISQPYIVALMTDILLFTEPGTGETLVRRDETVEIPIKKKVLEIGTGSGYQAAILGELVSEVYTIEIVEPLGLAAKNTLESLNYKNVFVRIGDGYKGWPEKAPFDRIIVTCAPEEVPDALLKQLNSDGGRMVIPVGPCGQTQELLMITRNGNKYARRFVTYVAFVPMVGGK